MKKKYKLCVIGTSSGGFTALTALIPSFPKNLYPVVIVIHQSETSDNFLVEYLNEKSNMHVKEAESSEKILDGNVYIAPPGYHLLIESDQTLSFSKEEPINFSRPSIDVLFESAAVAYQNRVIGVLLTGANSDGSAGLLCIKEKGGLTIVQDPTTAEAATMPLSAINLMKVDKILNLEDMVTFLVSL